MQRFAGVLMRIELVAFWSMATLERHGKKRSEQHDTTTSAIRSTMNKEGAVNAKGHQAADVIVKEAKQTAEANEDVLTGRFKVVIFRYPGATRAGDVWEEEIFSSFRQARSYADHYSHGFMTVMIDGEVEDKRYPGNGWRPVKTNGTLPKGRDCFVYCRTGV